MTMKESGDRQDAGVVVWLGGAHCLLVDTDELLVMIMRW